jgi:hypothetical protein
VGNMFVLKTLIKLIFTFNLIALGSVSVAKEITSQVEELANQNYYRKSLISLLYDNEIDYRSAFDCTSVMFEVPNDRNAIDAACVTDFDVLWISTSMGPKQRLGSAYVCPTKQDDILIKKLKTLAYESDETPNGIQYYMGRTDGWLRDFENILAIIVADNMSLSCWSLLRR